VKQRGKDSEAVERVTKRLNGEEEGGNGVAREENVTTQLLVPQGQKIVRRRRSQQAGK